MTKAARCTGLSISYAYSALMGTCDKTCVMLGLAELLLFYSKAGTATWLLPTVREDQRA